MSENETIHLMHTKRPIIIMRKYERSFFVHHTQKATKDLLADVIYLALEGLSRIA